MTGASASCFGEQYRDLLLYLHQKLDENNCNQQVQTDVQQYIQYTMVTLYFLQMVIPLMLFAGEELHRETYGMWNRRRNVYSFLEV